MGSESAPGATGAWATLLPVKAVDKGFAFAPPPEFIDVLNELQPPA